LQIVHRRPVGNDERIGICWWEKDTYLLISFCYSIYIYYE